METVNDAIKGVLDSFFDVGDQDKVIHINLDDTKLVATAIEEVLKNKGVI